MTFPFQGAEQQQAKSVCFPFSIRAGITPHALMTTTLLIGVRHRTMQMERTTLMEIVI